MIEPIKMDLYKVHKLSLGKRLFIISQTPCYSIVNNGVFALEMNPISKKFYLGDGVTMVTYEISIIDAMDYLSGSDYQIDHEVLEWLLFNLWRFT